MHSVERGALPNGLSIITVRRPGLHGAHASIWFPVGSRDDDPPGMAHFYEHCSMRSSSGHSAAAISAAFDALGASSNASTAREYTQFEVSARPKRLARAARLLGELVTAPTFEGYDVERAAVLAEIADECDDTSNLGHAVIFRGNPLARDSLGTRAAVERIGRRALQAHHARHINATGAVAIAAGPLRHDALRAVLAGAFADLTPLSAGARPERVPPRLHPRCVRLHDTTIGSTTVSVSFSAPPVTSPSEPAVSTLARLLSDGLTSPLYKQLRESLGLVYRVDSEYVGYADAGVFEVYATTEPKNAARVVSAILGVLSEAASRPPTRASFTRTRDALDHQILQTEDSVRHLAEFYAWGAIVGKRETLSESRKAYAAVTSTDVLAAARSIFDPSRLAVVVSGRHARRAEAAVREAVRAFAKG